MYSTLTSRKLIAHSIDCGFYCKESKQVELLISQMRNQLDVVEKDIVVKHTKEGKSDDQQSFINFILTSIATTPISENKSQRS